MNKNQGFDLQNFLKQLTTAPGIYRMIDSDDHVLYVGKAANLKKRVGSYFNKPQVSTKTQSLVSQIARIEVSVTHSETEALLLESNLIKSLRPKYNVLMRDDKSYPYLVLSTNHPYPRLYSIRLKKRPEKGIFFGPFPSATALRETINLIQKIFKIRNCTDPFFNSRQRPCLQYQIKRCSAPCTKYISKDDYQYSVQHAMSFLQGKCNQIIDDLAEKMDEAANRLAFEEAAQYRDKIKSLRLIQEQQSITRMAGDADVIVIEARPGFACVECVTVRDGQIIESQHFFPSIPMENFEELHLENALWEKVFSVFIAYYYIDNPKRIPKQIVTNHPIADKTIIENLLSEISQVRCTIQTQVRGIKKRWIDFAMNNLHRAIEEYTASGALLQKRYAALQQFLQRHDPIHKMICFDISHTQGDATIASCVCFDKNGPNKQEYRYFNIQNIKKSDDYAAMRQAITRYFKQLIQNNKPLPDITIIDGGKGQVHIAEDVLKELNLQHLMLIGIAKGPTRKAGLEHLIISGQHFEQTLPSDSPALHLLQHIRDESHRFAITAHRKKREKSSLRSTLESIDGIGNKRRQALLRRFGGIQELAKAPIEEIAKTEGISQKLAELIYQHFHG